MNISTISQKATTLVKIFEGCKLKSLSRCVGIWTIGYERTKGVKRGNRITQEQVNKYLQ